MSEADRVSGIVRKVLDEFKAKKTAFNKDPVDIELNGTEGFYACKDALRKALRKNGIRKFDMELTDKLRVYVAGLPRALIYR